MKKNTIAYEELNCIINEFFNTIERNLSEKLNHSEYNDFEVEFINFIEKIKKLLNFPSH
jgi:hypothetical protein